MDKKDLLNQVDKKKIMGKAFALLKKQGRNTAEGLLNFLKERKLLDDGTEKIAKQALATVSDPKNIDYSKFAEVCGSVAKQKGLDMENISKRVAASLFGGILGAGSAPAGSSKSPFGLGDPGTSGNVGTTNEDDDHHQEDDHESSDDHSDSVDDHHESTDDHHESTDDHHESTDDHHESTDEHHESENNHH